MKKLLILLLALTLVGCEYSSETTKTIQLTRQITNKQSTPTDIDFSLERYNLIKRAYWVNGQREKALTLVAEIQKPLGYIVLFSGNTVVGRFVVDGKVSSLNSFLTPDSEYYSSGNFNSWLADVDGSYGKNDDGIFFFTPDGKYIEWTGTYLYSDIPLEVDNPIVRVE